MRNIRLEKRASSGAWLTSERRSSRIQGANKKWGTLCGKKTVHSSRALFRFCVLSVCGPQGYKLYPVFPAVSLAELYKLIRTVKAVLPEVHVPTLIIHSREDDSHSLRSVDLLEQQLGSTVKAELILDNSYHVVMVDYQKEKVAAEVTRFFQRF